MLSCNIAIWVFKTFWDFLVCYNKYWLIISFSYIWTFNSGNISKAEESISDQSCSFCTVSELQGTFVLQEKQSKLKKKKKKQRTHTHTNLPCNQTASLGHTHLLSAAQRDLKHFRVEHREAERGRDATSPRIHRRQREGMHLSWS